MALTGKQMADIIVWDKGFGQPAMHEKVLNSAYELIIVLESDSGAGRVLQSATFARGEMSNIMRVARETSEIDGHNATFPLELARKLILSFSKKGDSVLDPFMGSGTTAVACIDTHRNYIGFEISKMYYESARKRIDDAKAQVRWELC